MDKPKFLILKWKFSPLHRIRHKAYNLVFDNFDQLHFRVVFFSTKMMKMKEMHSWQSVGIQRATQQCTCFCYFDIFVYYLASFIYMYSFISISADEAIFVPESCCVFGEVEPNRTICQQGRESTVDVLRIPADVPVTVETLNKNLFTDVRTSSESCTIGFFS